VLDFLDGSTWGCMLLKASYSSYSEHLLKLCDASITAVAAAAHGEKKMSNGDDEEDDNEVRQDRRRYHTLFFLMGAAPICLTTD
jgi:hypothetical protein